MESNVDMFVHGDNQYGVERALALLEKEGFVVGGERQRKDTKLAHVGDNGDYYWGTEERDLKAWEVLPDFYDEMLIGNHEGAVLFGHILGGYSRPLRFTEVIMKENYDSGKLKFATSADGFLITHAGVHTMFEDELPDDPVEAAEKLNEIGRENPDHYLISNVARIRGGFHSAGGILWRDIEEECSSKWPQIFGHSRQPAVTEVEEETGVKHYAIDVGYPNNGRIAGIYTKDQKVVEVNINEQ